MIGLVKAAAFLAPLSVLGFIVWRVADQTSSFRASTWVLLAGGALLGSLLVVGMYRTWTHGIRGGQAREIVSSVTLLLAVAAFLVLVYFPTPLGVWAFAGGTAGAIVIWFLIGLTALYRGKIPRLRPSTPEEGPLQPPVDPTRRPGPG